MLCPACENESENTQQCTNCGWQFVYFTQEPSEKEQNEYTILLQNYRTELYWTLAAQYYDNKQYEEAIECCKISCEHNLFENPLGLMASAYLQLGCKTEALSFANMALNINPNNEFSLLVLKNLNRAVSSRSENFEKEFNLDSMQQLTTKILKKGMFETTEEYKQKIENIGYIRIGTIVFKDYNPDTQELTFIPYYDYDDNGIKDYDGFTHNHYDGTSQDDYNIDFDLNISGVIQHTQMIPSKAQKVYENAKLIARITIERNSIKIVDIMVNNNSFLNSINQSTEKIINYKDATEIWTDKETGLMWEVKSLDNINIKYTYDSVNEYIVSLNKKDFGGYNDWRLPTIKELESILSDTAINNKFIKRALSHNCSYFHYWSSENASFDSRMVMYAQYHSNGRIDATVKNNACHIRCVRG